MGGSCNQLSLKLYKAWARITQRSLNPLGMLDIDSGSADTSVNILGSQKTLDPHESKAGHGEEGGQALGQSTSTDYTDSNSKNTYDNQIAPTGTKNHQEGEN